MKISVFQNIRPVTVISVIVLLALLFFTFAVYEFVQFKKNIDQLMEQEGFVLLDALLASGERSILANEILETSLSDRLAGHARLIAELGQVHQLSQNKLSRLADELDLECICLIDARGRLEMSNLNRGEGASSVFIPGLLDSLKSLSHYDIGFISTGNSQKREYAVACKRKTGGAVVVTVASEQLLEIRKQVGTGRLVQEIGNRAGVAYVAVQDTLGILMASRSVKELSSMQADEALRNVFDKQVRLSRLTDFEGKTVFELAGPFHIENEQFGIMRIGLDLAPYQRLIRDARYRIGGIALVYLAIGLVGITLVIMVQNHRMLTASYDRFRTQTSEILNKMDDGVIVIDREDRCIVFNPSAESLFQLSARQVINRTLEDLNTTPLICLLKLMQENKPGVHHESECMVGGRKRIFRISISHIHNPLKERESVIFIVTDMTRERQLEEQVRRQDQLKAMGALASGVAHEIRNPMNAIGMIVQRFAREFHPQDGEEEYRQLAKLTVDEVRRINTIIERFLAFARPAPLQLQSVRIAEIIRQSVDLIKTSAEEKGVSLSFNSQNDPELPADPSQIKQVFLNLLQNALDACEAGDSIEVSGEPVQDSYLIRIKDMGQGIAESDKARLFEIYFTTKDNGTGMGLPIAQQIIQAHHGEIHLESAEGKGSVFTILLPLHPMEKE